MTSSPAPAKHCKVIRKSGKIENIRLLNRVLKFIIVVPPIHESLLIEMVPN